MIRPCLLLLAIVLISGCSASKGQPRTMPARFQGEWNASLEHCGTGRSDTRLRIGAEHIRFYESRGPIRAVVTRGKRDVAVIVELSGEGRTWLSYRHFRLSVDRDTLTDVTRGDSGMVRYRCPTGSR